MLLELVDVKKEYHQGHLRVPALRGIDLQVARGEFASIAGPSGSGKSTLLNLVGCLDKPTSGTIRFAGRDLSTLSKQDLADIRRHKVGFVFQSFNLIPVLTAYENVEFALALLSVPEREAREKVMAALEAVGLADLAGRRPAQLSGGQQQRVAIARALVKRPELVLADEPTANLDSENGEAILGIMQELNREHGTTFIFSTHDPMVMQYAHRLITVRDGRIAADEVRSPRNGSSGEVTPSPAKKEAWQ